MRAALLDLEVVDRATDGPSEHAYEAFRVVPRVDWITVDPHGLGHVPYATGGFVVRDKRALDVISFSAPYHLEESAKALDRLGSYILEGSKSRVTAAAALGRPPSSSPLHSRVRTARRFGHRGGPPFLRTSNPYRVHDPRPGGHPRERPLL